MSVIRSLSLNTVQSNYYLNTIKERVVSRFDVEADFGQLLATEVDFSYINRNSVEKMSNSIGKQFKVPVKTKEGLDGELLYTEVNGAWHYHVATHNKDEEKINQFHNKSKNNKNYRKLMEHVLEKGYTLKTEEEYLIDNVSYLEDIQGNISQESSIYIVPIYQNALNVGVLAFNENEASVLSINNERTFFNETDELVSIQADSCSLTWTECMADCLPGCDTWRGCLILFGGCLGACCGCVSVIPCIACGVCLFVGVSCLWACRMCVSGAARPQECPTR